jgi:hypothetical protein
MLLVNPHYQNSFCFLYFFDTRVLLCSPCWS